MELDVTPFHKSGYKLIYLMPIIMLHKKIPVHKVLYFNVLDDYSHSDLATSPGDFFSL